MNEELNALAEILHSCGWTSPSDAQWTRLEAAIPDIRELLSVATPPAAVAKSYAKWCQSADFRLDPSELLWMAFKGGRDSADAVAVPDGWDKGRYHYTTLFNAIAAAVSVNAGGSLGISVGAFENAMLAAAPASPAATGWLPIETAPKDGKMFLVLLPQQGRLIVRARYDTIHGHWLTDYEGEGGITRPYFFHPGDLWHLLPPAPSVDGEGE